MKIVFYLTFAIVVFQSTLNAQDDIVLSYDKFIADVKSNHPLVTIAKINNDIQDTKRQEASGAFDPVISASVDRKVFKDDLYYSYQNAEIYLPTWYGIEVYSGIENNGGLNSNPELTIGDLTYAGISIPLGRDLLLDKRRAKLSEAKLMQSFTVNEQRIAINDLLLDASITYTNWALTYAETQLLLKSLDLIRIRKQAVINAVSGGDRAATDTIELNAQFNSIMQSYQAAMMDFNNTYFELSSYLWDDNNSPLLVNDNVVPDTTFLDFNMVNILLNRNPNEVALAHPKIKMIDTKLKIEELGQRLAFQSLLPKADLKYNIISSGILGSSLFEQALNENYKFGIDFSMPIPNRSARAGNRIQRAKIKSLEFEKELNLNQISVKAQALMNEAALLKLQLQSIERAIDDYTKLREAEFLRFRMGESSVFLINARDNKVIETNLKALDISAKLKKTEMKLRGLNFEL